MRIPCPLCGTRDAQDFTYLGDASPRRPEVAVGPHAEVAGIAGPQSTHNGPASVEAGLRPAPQDEDEGSDTYRQAMFEYVYLRDNPAGPLRELWYHGAGCHAWLTVTRDTRTHEILGAELASDARRETAP